MKFTKSTQNKIILELLVELGQFGNTDKKLQVCRYYMIWTETKKAPALTDRACIQGLSLAVVP